MEKRIITRQAVIENNPEVIGFVEETLEEMECPMGVSMQITIAVDELFSNVAFYAYKDLPGEPGDCTVSIEDAPDGNGVSITFVDSGIPYDPLAKEDPDVTLSAEERQIGGLGIFIVKKSMDNVIYERRDDQNHLTIIKKFK